MAIALSAVVPSELRAPANPIAVKGNTLYTRTFRVVIPASTTVAALTIGSVPPGTLCVGAVIDTDTSLATGQLALSTADAIFVAAGVQTVTGGQQKTLATALGVIAKSSNTADVDVVLTSSVASSPASEVIVDVTLVLCSIGPVEDARETFDT